MSSLGHSRPTHSVPVPTDVRYSSDSDHSKHESEWTLSADTQRARISLRSGCLLSQNL
jgi:hypothetical protein